MAKTRLQETFEDLFPAACPVLTIGSNAYGTLTKVEQDRVIAQMLLLGKEAPLLVDTLSNFADKAKKRVDELAPNGLAVVMLLEEQLTHDEIHAAWRTIKSAFTGERMCIVINAAGPRILAYMTDIQIAPTIHGGAHFTLTRNKWGQTGKRIFLGRDALGQFIIEDRG